MTSTPNLSRRTSLIDYISSLPIRPRLPSIRSRKSTASSTHKDTAFSQHNMLLALLKDADATTKLLEFIIDTPNGRRSVARLARTCKGFKEPALNVLWRDLDSFVPLLGLFPNNLLRRARRPGLGLARNPEPADWERVLSYGDRVRGITYTEAYNNVSASVFPVFEEYRPRQYILPNLTSLTWKAETAAGLERSLLFITPGLQSLTIEMGAKYPKMGDFLNEVMSRTQLSSFSFTLHSNLPDNFVDILQPNAGFQKLALMAPGALSARVGMWAASIPTLKSFQVDLSNRTTTAVEGFFDDISPGSGYSTPSSVGGDSGVFSGDELDFSDLRKGAMRITSDAPRYGAFRRLTQLGLTGETSNIATFLKHLASPLTTIDLAIEDPPQREDWQDLCNLISDQFSHTLQSLRIGATSNSRFNELVRSTSRGGEVQLRHLPLEYFAFLPELLRLEIDLPESAVFHNRDIAHIARVCPNLEILRLCNQAKFPPSFGSPFLTLEGLAPLTTECKRLHTLAVVVNALEGREEIFRTMEPSSRSLLRLHVGHSWIKDPLNAALLISHLAPHLESLKWFTATTRPGVVEANAANWQKVSEFLPPIQRMRIIERSLLPMPQAPPPPPRAHKEVDATIATSECGITASPDYREEIVQVSPDTVEQEVEALPEMHSVEIDATPELVDTEVLASPTVSEVAVETITEMASGVVDTDEATSPSTAHPIIPPVFSAVLPTVSNIVNFPVRVVKFYTYYATLPLRFMFFNMPIISNYANSEKDPQSPIPGGLENEEETATDEKSSMPPSMPPTMPIMPSHMQPSFAEKKSDAALSDSLVCQ
ncbi:hypothetical protein K474DRAFT_312829 [Panus rudis PR-1116 ss-1]|nr:hypothetical protein K474DRAFT_312829 [Panus rudis PR-1116 ss-1]